MADIKEEQMAVVDSVDYLRGLQENSSVKIAFSQMRQIFKSLVITSKSDANDSNPGEWVYINSLINNYPFSSGYLMTLGGSDQMIQFAIKSDGEQIKIRIRIYSNWSKWRSITLT